MTKLAWEKKNPLLIKRAHNILFPSNEAKP